MDVPVLEDLDLRKGQRVFVRVDFNVPMSDGVIEDDLRIVSALPTIEHLLDRHVTVVLGSHLGRPKGTVDPKSSMAPVAAHLGALLGREVPLAPHAVGPVVEELVAGSEPGSVVMLENLRWNAGEEANDPAFAANLAMGYDAYVNDAFGACHRAHASIVGPPQVLPSAAGRLLAREVEVLGRLLEGAEPPFVAVLGGAKVSGKIGLIRNLLDRVDRIVIGGGMAFTFFKAAGLEIGTSLLDESYLDMCRELMERSGKGPAKRIFLPVDCVVAKEIAAGAEHRTVSTGDIPEDWAGVDIGEKTVTVFRDELVKAGTIFWNGPMGVFEIPEFAEGTKRVARAIVEATSEGATSVVGGGDSVAALGQLHLKDRVTHVSTGGGASLEMLEGKVLPGVAALSDA